MLGGEFIMYTDFTDYLESNSHVVNEGTVISDIQVCCDDLNEEDNILTHINEVNLHGRQIYICQICDAKIVKFKKFIKHMRKEWVKFNEE